MQVKITVNGEGFTREIEARLLLVHFLRGEPVKSCTVLAATASGHTIRTVEGLEVDGVLDPVQEGFRAEHGLQCGFCTSGMMLTARALLDRHRADPARAPLTDIEIREAISGQICRCTGYMTIVRSIRWAAAREAEAEAAAA
jgi:carbon-monoxide dehydrogenase small subunit